MHWSTCVLLLGAVSGTHAQLEDSPVDSERPKLILCPNDEIWIDCKSGYCKPQYCRDLNVDIGCPQVAEPCPGGCICRDGLLRNEDEVCIPKDQCPISKPCPDPNAIRKKCASHESCRPTCSVPNSMGCPKICIINGCECKKGYVLSAKGGKCVKIDNCPKGNVSCNGDPNAVIKAFPEPCPSTCELPNGIPGCLKLGPDVGCECKPGYLKANDTGNCILPADCKAINKPCDDPNAERLECAPAPICRSTCATPNRSPCILSCAINECVCKKGYTLSAKGGKCIPWNECPKDAPCNGDINAVIKTNPIPCPSTCNAPNADPYCEQYAPSVGCECRPGYLRADDGGTCIKPDECPGGNPCGINGTFVERADDCPSSYCPEDNTSRAIIACSPPPALCPSGCACKKDYKRNSTSAYIYTCILASECLKNKPCDDPNAERLECAPAPSCRSTCAVPNPSPCIKSCAVNECVCKKGYVLSEKDGKCIPINECPKDVPCNGDSNAVIKANPIPCPSTCNSPDASPWCKRYAPPVGCECKPGYLQIEDGGKCIQPDKCPGGNPCGANETFVWCKGRCLTDYCPVDDRLEIVACSLPYPCPSGCVCKLNYRRKSVSDDTCILASTCPPVKCSCPNEIWNPCPSACLRERCSDVNNQPTTCNTLVLNCQPRCVCKKGYFRNDTNICIPGKDCPNNKCSDPNAERVECALATACRPSCAVPNPGPCISQICIKNECICKKGYVLSEKGGKCVTADQCPIQKSCNGDPNAQIKKCPLPCPATCDTPNAIPCRKACVPIGCECKDGYILSETNGKCILPEKCKGGYPCGRNETFVPCKVPCPSDYCPVGNSPNTVICETPNPCYPGCVCKFNYRRKSVDDRRCIYASECPPQICKKNEVWSPCPSECLQEDCSDAKKTPVVCNTLLLNCQPKCICKKGYYRDSNSNCVPASQCPKPIQCKDNEVYNTCRIICPPQTCASIYTDYDCRNASKRCEPGCDCMPEYLRNGTANDPCIPSSQCPTTPPVTPECGINEHYETNRYKCEVTCKNYALECSMGLCEATSACFCDAGHVRNSNGHCISKKQCPQNIDCPPNEVVSECYNSCHKTCKTRLRSDGRMCHLACIQTGCLCKEGYLRHDNGKCVPINECSPPRCDENETYSSCGTACPPTCQNRGDNCTACTKQCAEDCFCNKGLVRAEDGTCVKPKDCPKRTCNDPNEWFDPCPPTCPPTDNCSNIWSKFDCTNAIKCCKPQCRCKPGYYRKDICVPINQC